MTITGCLLLVLWLGIIPLSIGALPAAFVEKKRHSISFMWTTGYLLMWAVFQVMSVPFILKESIYRKYYPTVVTGYAVVSLVLAAVGILLWIYKGKKAGHLFQKPAFPVGKKAWLAWGCAVVLIGLQLVCSVFLRYADGDDAFYVAVSTIAQESDTMYLLAPYSMGGVGLNTRHSLAPFPIWIAFLARVTGSHTAFVAHTVVATVLIFMTYVIYYQIGEVLFAKKRNDIPVFLSLTALLVIFGDYSIYTAENFMIARSRQGKAALGNIIVPMMILLFLLLFERIKEEKKAEWMLWVLIAVTVTAACLCSTLGTFLMCLFLGVIGLCAGVVYRRFGLVWKTALCCIPALVYVALYFGLG